MSETRTITRPKPVAAIVGGASLLGRELRELLSQTGIQTRLVGADRSETGMLTEEAGEPVVMTAMDEESLTGSRVAFLAGSAESSRSAVEVVARLDPRPALIDLTYSLEDRPGAYLRAPLAEPPSYVPPTSSEHVVAHPAAIAIALFLTRLEPAARIRRAIVHVFEPASERGRRGVEELEKQTVSLLTFKPLPKAVFDDQVGFNMLARLGSEASDSIADIGLRIERHLAAILALHGRATLASLRLIQAPVFHGHSFSLWVEFEERPEIKMLEEALASSLIDIRGPDLDPPNVVGVAGQSGISIGAIEPDRANPSAAWFWGAADNIRMMAENAVAVAQSLFGRTGSARPQ